MNRARPVVALVLAQIFSIASTRLSMIAIPWLVLTLTGDAVLTGFVAFAEMAPYVLAKLLGGPLIDRVGARTVSIIGDLASVLTIALVPLLAHLDALTMMTLVPVVVVLGALRGPADAAVQAMVPAVAHQSGMKLTRMTGLIGTIERLAAALGAGLAGVLIAALGPAPALLINALAFALSAAAIAFGLPQAPKPIPNETQSGTYWAQLREGFTFVSTDPVLVGIAMMIAITNMLDQAWSTVLLPVWAQEGGSGPEALGLAFAVMSGFSVLGALCATLWADRLPRLAVYASAFLIVSLPRFAIFALDSPLAGILATLAICGFASGFLNPIISAVIFERIPEKLVGRASSLITASAWALMPFGGLLGGALIGWQGLASTLWIIGIAYLGVTLAPLAMRRFRAM